ncbi:transposase [Aneurinibacillus migulanus]|uniref:transposase n=1 Tax=Aneurinibacillus migulanus TaxID=47500 RepID=UPI001113CB57
MEVGHPSSYSHPCQIQKISGFNLKENSLGKYKGRTCITKGDRYCLRILLYKCVIALVAKHEQFKVLHNKFTARTMNLLRKNSRSLLYVINRFVFPSL